VAISPDVGSFIERELGRGNLLRRNLIRNVARKASSVILTTGMVAPLSRRWEPWPSVPPIVPGQGFSFHAVLA
jgi:hypothetical protein